jgi:ferric-dicitrate binding protein FerR (iron transport regulator)
MEQPRDYQFYTANDFIMDEAFLQWVRQPDTASDAWWNAWIDEHPHKRQQIEEARAFITLLQFHEQLPDQQMIATSLERNLTSLAPSGQSPLPESKSNIGSKLIRWAIAAAVMLGIVVAARYLLLQPAMIKVAGYKDRVRTVRLPDSSLVRLNAGAALSFNKNWKKPSHRQVWLQGEAFFDIKPIAAGSGTAHGFVVHSGDLHIDVLGTSFNVKERELFTNVTLNTGKIRLSFKGLPTPLILSPGDFVQYRNNNNRIIRKKVNAALYAVWKEERQQLDNVTLQELACYIEDTYNYHVKISDAVLARQKISGGLRVKDEASLFETLSFALNLKINKKADTLFIESSN